MKKYILLLLTVFITAGLFARTPAESLIYKYENVKGAKVLEASGGRMVFVRPVLRKYPIGPMADDVEGVVVLKLEKVEKNDLDRFLSDFKETAKVYIRYGKFEIQNGYVDVYVHMKSEQQADELVIYNPELRTLNSLSGVFPVEKLLMLDKSKKN